MFKDQYIRNKEKLLNDTKFNSKNIEVIKKFLEFEEYKLKRKEGLTEVDERSYKTLTHYLTRIKNLNKWFKNKAWEDLTEKDIKKFIDDLEDGVIKSKFGKRLEDRSGYYQMIQGKFFSFTKNNHLARQILEDFSIKGRDFNKQVRFIEFESFLKIANCINNPIYLCLLWLAWDIGENIGTLLTLEAGDFQRQVNSDTNEAEYLVILPKEKLKRSRTARSEITNYNKTVKYLDIVLANLKPANKKTSHLYPKDRLFKFGMKAAEKFFRRAVELSGVRCMPGGEKVTFKDLRSSMACDLLVKEWTTDEINSRLGHKPSSRQIDKYVNYLALKSKAPKKKIYNGNIKKLEGELERQKEVNRLQGLRFESLKNDQLEIKQKLEISTRSNNEEMEQMRDFIKIIKQSQIKNNNIIS